MTKGGSTVDFFTPSFRAQSRNLTIKRGRPMGGSQRGLNERGPPAEADGPLRIYAPCVFIWLLSILINKQLSHFIIRFIIKLALSRKLNWTMSLD